MLLDKYCAEMRIKIRGNYALPPPIKTEEIHKNAAYIPIFFATPLFMPNILRSEQILNIFRRWFDDKIDKI